MSTILDTLTQQLSGGTLSQMSRQLGIDEATTQNAVSVALPLLLGGLARNAAQPAGADALGRALDQDHDGSVLDDPAPLLSNPQAFSGGGILGHILGSRQAPVAEGVGRATGMNQQQVMQLLIMLAPLIMGALGRAKRQQGIDSGGLGSVLQREQAQIEQRAPGAGGILGGLLDRDNDGQIADDIARMGGGVLGSIFGRRA